MRDISTAMKTRIRLSLASRARPTDQEMEGRVSLESARS